MQSDLAAIQRWISSRDPEAFHVLVQHYSGMVYATCRRVLGNSTDAEDAVQESFQALAMLRAAPKHPLGAWLHRVAVYKALNMIRAEKRRAQRGKAYAGQETAVEAGWDDLYAYVDEAVASLPDKYRVAVVRHFLQGETQEVIAQEMGVTRQAVAYRIQCGLEGIRKALRRHGITTTVLGLSAMFAQHAQGSPVPELLMAKLGKMALMGKGVPTLPVTFWSQLHGAVFSSKGAAILLAVMGLAMAGSLYSLRYELAELEWPKIFTVLKGHGTARPQQLLPAPPAAVAVAVVRPDFEALPAGSPAAAFAGVREVPRLRTIHGVLRSDSGAPQPGVSVRLTRTSAMRWANCVEEDVSWTASTDGAGRFVFSELPVCSENVLRGWETFRLSAEGGGRYAIKAFEMLFWELSSFQELVFQGAGFLECSVLNEQGMPVPQATVRLKDASRMFGTLPIPEPVPLGSEGRGTIGPLLPGVYTVVAQAAGYGKAEQVVSYDAGSIQLVLSPEAALQGRVIDAETREALAGVSIEGALVDKRTPAGFAESDAHGGFTLAMPGAPGLMIRARLDGKCLAEGWREIRLSPASREGLVLELAPGGTVSGRALDPVTGAGVANIPVCFLYAGEHWSTSRITGFTDADGLYTLTGIAGQGEVKALDFYDPGCARAVTVAAGETVGPIDFTLPTGCRIAGRVVRGDHTPVGSMVVAAMSLRNEEKRSQADVMRYMAATGDDAGSLSDEEGRFVCYTRGNTGRVYLQAFGRDQVSSKIGPIEVPDHGVAGLVVRVEPAGGLSGRVLDAGSRPVSGVNIVLQPLDPLRGSMILGREWASRAIDTMPKYYPSSGLRRTSMGGFAFETLLPGKYRVMAFLDASCASSPLASQEITVVSGETQDLSLAVDMQSLSGLRGVVTAAGRPQPRMKVSVVNSGAIEEVVAITGADGSYEILRLPGTTVEVQVSTPGAMNTLAEARAELVAGQMVTLDIDVPVGSGRVEGTILMDGVPAVGKPVWLGPFDGAKGQSLEAKTDAHGNYVIEQVLAGLYVVGLPQTGVGGHSPTQSLVLVSDGQTERRDFNIGGSTITVTMTGVEENERGHLVIVPDEVILDELTESRLMALAPRAIKYVRTRSDTDTYAFPGLASGTYTVFGAAHPREEEGDEGEAIVASMRVLYSVVTISKEQPGAVSFDFTPSGPVTGQ